MNKTDALARLAALETETAALRRIIEEPEVKGLWKPQDCNEFWYHCAYSADVVDLAGSFCPIAYRNQLTAKGNAFQSRKIAEKAAPLMARANKIIAAALQADPDAGAYADNRRRTATSSLHRMAWEADEYSGAIDAPTAMIAFVHTKEQAEEMARILNAEGVK
jgi:hypothetical protein